jgi:hypothetical protein
MKLRPLLAASTVALVVAASALGAASSLTGTFVTKIAGKSAALNGTWTLKLLPAGKFQTLRNGKVVVSGDFAAPSGTLQLIDKTGPYACKGGSATGIYDYKVAGKSLVLKPIAEFCVPRKTILTTHPLLKQ